MKRNGIAALIAFILALSTALASLTVMRRTANELEAMRVDILRLAEAGDAEHAAERIAHMADAWAARKRLLEIVAPHETLHTVSQLIVEADTAFAARDSEDFSRTMRLLGLALEHLYDEERFRIENIF